MTEQAQKPEIKFYWGPIFLGFLGGYGIAILIAVVAGVAGQMYNPVTQPAGGLAAALVAGIIAGKRAASAGAFNGAAAAGVYIIFLSILKGIDEIAIVEMWGWHALPKMDMTGLLIWDILYLSAGAFGGWLVRR